MLSRLLLAAVAAIVLAAPAFAQGRPKPSEVEPSVNTLPAQPKKFPTDMQWTLVSLSGRSITTERPTVMVDGQYRARGFGGCNAFSATAIPQAGQRFAVGPIAQTKKACDKSAMDFERAFLIAFRTAQIWDLKDGYLIMAGQGGELKFERGL